MLRKRAADKLSSELDLHFVAIIKLAQRYGDNLGSNTKLLKNTLEIREVLRELKQIIYDILLSSWEQEEIYNFMKQFNEIKKQMEEMNAD